MLKCFPTNIQKTKDLQFVAKIDSSKAQYGKPLIAARDPKCSAKDAEAGALAMEALHKHVMPFLLRRTKDEVLSDLPEKIIQDRYCDLSTVQLKLYEQFSGSRAKKENAIMNAGAVLML
ncbi:hypothetical protein RYX36_023027 [Vicia faba]